MSWFIADASHSVDEMQICHARSGYGRTDLRTERSHNSLVIGVALTTASASAGTTSLSRMQHCQYVGALHCWAFTRKLSNLLPVFTPIVVIMLPVLI